MAILEILLITQKLKYEMLFLKPLLKCLKWERLILKKLYMFGQQAMLVGMLIKVLIFLAQNYFQAWLITFLKSKAILLQWSQLMRMVPLALFLADVVWLKITAFRLLAEELLQLIQHPAQTLEST